MFPPPVLVFDREGDIYVLPSMESAPGRLEMFDVLDGEYQAAFLPDGEVVELSGERMDPVRLSATGSHDQARLAMLLAAAATRRGRAWPTDDPALIAALLVHEDWEQRWPKRPAWLSRRLHGDPPLRPVFKWAGGRRGLSAVAHNHASVPLAGPGCSSGGLAPRQSRIGA
jgi:hypothetical protein